MTDQSNLSLKELTEAAQAVIERWDSPSWKDLPATADYIHRLRKAITAMGDASARKDEVEVQNGQSKTNGDQPAPIETTSPATDTLIEKTWPHTKEFNKFVANGLSQKVYSEITDKCPDCGSEMMEVCSGLEKLAREDKAGTCRYEELHEEKPPKREFRPVDDTDVEIAIAEAIAVMSPDTEYTEKGAPVLKHLKSLGYKVIEGQNT